MLDDNLRSSVRMPQPGRGVVANSTCLYVSGADWVWRHASFRPIVTVHIRDNEIEWPIKTPETLPITKPIATRKKEPHLIETRLFRASSTRGGGLRSPPDLISG